jgi:hypothetical protein
MKKFVLMSFGVLAISPVFAQTAQTVCGTGAPANYAIQSPAQFVVRSFPMRCSNNVTASTVETAVAIGVGSLSSKGKSYFQGTSGGGAINGTACGTTCTAGQETTGLVALVNAAT